ncbi:hypothetical protein FQA39_LY04785 [Lamprigera yunnana]|nr:hypothetical protein FQA39_LY04785 [Lamprigera yunnana]
MVPSFGINQNSIQVIRRYYLNSSGFNFDIVMEETNSLQQALLKVRKLSASLHQEIDHLHKVIDAEREKNIELYLHVEKDSNASISSCPTSTVSLHKYELLQLLHQQQFEIYNESLSTLRTVYEKCTEKLKVEVMSTLEHAIAISDMQSLYRKQVFDQKLRNERDHKQLLDNIHTLNKTNKKRILEIDHQMLETVTENVNDQTRKTLNSLRKEINDRDILVDTLQKQKRKVERDIENIKKSVAKGCQNSSHITKELQKKMENELKSYAALEKRRSFDFEGFQTDLQQFRKEMGKIKNVERKSLLESKIEDLEAKLCRIYRR